MPFCEKCGQQISAESKFCTNCGTRIKIPASSIVVERKQAYEGEVHKCPNCGEIVVSFKHVCSTCGFEFRNSSASNSVHEFAKEIAKIESTRKSPPPPVKGLISLFHRSSDSKPTDDVTDKNIASTIQNFPIPNTKEDILEFMILASSNIDIDALDKDSKNYSVVSEAWISKFEQTYKKAKIVFGSDPDFHKIKEIYNEKEGELKKNRLKRKMELPIILFFTLVVPWALIIPLLCLSNSDYVKREENRLQEIVANIENDISSGDFESALIRLNDLYYIPQTEKDDYDTTTKTLIQKWNTNQKLLMNNIISAMGENVLELASPISSEQAHGSPYPSIVDLFEDSGFIKVTAELATEIPTSETAGTVLEVSINGETSFSRNSKFPFNADIVILYYTDIEPPVEETSEPTNESTAEPIVEPANKPGTEVTDEPTVKPTTKPGNSIWNTLVDGWTGLIEGYESIVHGDDE